MYIQYALIRYKIFIFVFWRSQLQNGAIQRWPRSMFTAFRCFTGECTNDLGGDGSPQPYGVILAPQIRAWIISNLQKAAMNHWVFTQKQAFLH